MRTTKTISITLPAEMLDRAAMLAKKENRTMSALVREALRHYERQHWWDGVNAYGSEKAKERGLTEDDVDRVIHEHRQKERSIRSTE